MNADHHENIGIVQLVDFQGNPVILKFDIKSKITSSKNSVVQILEDPIIPAVHHMLHLKLKQLSH